MLKIERLPSSLSPSALMMAERMPNKFYLVRLINEQMPRDPQSLAAAVGSAFDYYIKEKLIHDKFSEKIGVLEEIRGSVETNLTEALRWGKNALDIYTTMAYDPNEIADIEIHNNYMLNFNGTKVPIFGKLDATSYHILKQLNIEIVIPYDWKVSGYTNSDTVSPHPGYYWSCENGISLKGAHKNYDYNISMEEINPDWATQTCTYGWISGTKFGTPFPARIDQIIFGRQNKISIYKYCGWITRNFQERVATRYVNLWNSIMSGDFIKQLASTVDDDIVWAKANTEVFWEKR